MDLRAAVFQGCHGAIGQLKTDPAVALRVVSSRLRPARGEGASDRSGPFDRALNVATSLIFLGIGASQLRQRTTPEGRAAAAGTLAVGVAASLYHVSKGPIRAHVMRRADYWTVAASSLLLARAAAPRTVPAAAVPLGLAVTPFAPFLVSTAATLAAEIAFIRRALSEPPVRPRGAAGRLGRSLSDSAAPRRIPEGGIRQHLARHAFITVAGLVAFFGDEMRPQGVPGAHAVWHVAAADTVRTLYTLIDVVEKERAAQGGASASTTGPLPSASARRGFTDTVGHAGTSAAGKGAPTRARASFDVSACASRDSSARPASHAPGAAPPPPVSFSVRHRARASLGSDMESLSLSLAGGAGLQCHLHGAQGAIGGHVVCVGDHRGHRHAGHGYVGGGLL